jgi:glycosyltransferase involved in cell wall biosynthesis
MKNILLIVSGFPYAGGEPFLREEINLLARGFGKVFILTINPSGSDIVFPIPENAAIIPRKKINYAGAFFKYLFSRKAKGFWKSFLKGIWKMIFPGYFIRQLYLFFQGWTQIENVRSYFKDNTEKVDLIYSYWLWAHAFTGAEIKRNLYPEAGLVSRAHRYDLFNDFFWGAMPQKKWIIGRIDRIYSISETGEKYLKAYCPEYSEKFRVSRLGVGGNISGASPSRKIDGAELRIVSCSSLQPRKRVDYIIHALAHYKGTRPIVWEHLGGGASESVYRVLAEKLLTGGNIRFVFHGAMSHDQVMGFYHTNYAEIDLFVNASSSEGVPVSGMEAMSFGIPAAAFDVGGNGELVNDTNGVLLPYSKDPHVLAEVFERFAAMDEKSLTAVRKNAYQTWKEKYNAGINFPAFVKEIKNMAEH